MKDSAMKNSVISFVMKWRDLIRVGLNKINLNSKIASKIVSEYVAAFYLDLVTRVNEIFHRYMRNYRQRHCPDFP